MEPNFPGPNENFIEQLRRALEHMYDLPYLQRHPLAFSKGLETYAPGETPGQRLRRALMDAIETLNPGPGVFFRSPQARPYQMLHMHCVDGMSIADAAKELGISERQAYRDLRQGEESIISILYNILKPELTDLTNNEISDSKQDSSLPDNRPGSVQDEIARLHTIRQQVDLRDLLQRALKAVEKLAEIQSVKLITKMEPEAFWLTISAAGAQQLLVSLLSRLIQSFSLPGVLSLDFSRQQNGTANLVFTYIYPGDETPSFLSDAVISGLLTRLNWDLRLYPVDGNTQQIILTIKQGNKSILVIDDNEGLLDLFARFMTGVDCQMISARSASEGLALAGIAHPSAIILDVMMPDMDGWEILQRLRSNPQTSHIPIGICSVVDDPGLAYSLGASMLITKPVTREKVLSALRHLGLVHN